LTPPESYGTVALVQLARLGDLAQTWPLLRALRSRDGPDSVILIVDERLAALAAAMVGSRNVVPLPVAALRSSGGSAPHNRFLAASENLVECLQRRPVDAVINLNFHSAAAAVAESIPARRRLGARWADVLAGRPSDAQTLALFRATTGRRTGARHLCDLWLDYVGEDCRRQTYEPLTLPTELRAQAENLLTGAGVDPDRDLVAIIPGAGLAARCWPLEYFSALTEQVLGEVQVVLVGTQADAPLADEIIRRTRGRKLPASLCGQTDPATLTAVLERCRLVIGVDTGALHIAAVVGSQCLGIYFGSMNYLETGPYGEGHLILTPGDSEYPCFEWELERRADYHRYSVPPELAIETAAAMLAGREPSAMSGGNAHRAHLTMDDLKWVKVGGPPMKLIPEKRAFASSTI